MTPDSHIRHLPNILTILRMAVTPAILVLLFSGSLAGRAAALTLFVLAAISDYADGHIARRISAPTRMGRFLDPLADKVLVLGTFVGLAILLPDLVPWWAVALVALRDIAVTGLRMRAEARGSSVRTMPMAKTKTTVQLVFLIGMLATLVAVKLPGVAGRVGAWVLGSPVPTAVLLIVVIVTVLTGLAYFYRPQFVGN